MFHLACTRFNNSTYKENVDYRNKHNENVIYGASLKIRNIYSIGSLIFVAEMNNEKNKIEGVGLIKNQLVLDKRHKIYENGEYNSYIYRGKYWLSRETLENLDPAIIEIFDNILFKGKSHLKCRTGITILTEKLFTHWIYELRILKNKIKCVFLDHYKHNIDFEPEECIKEQIRNEEESFEIIPKKRRLLICDKNIEN
jgi:hypothetical protein